MIKTFKQKIESVIDWSKEVTLPGFEGVPLYNVVSFIIKELNKESINIRASALAFNFFLALFPFVIFLFTLIPYVPLRGLKEEILTSLKDVMPVLAYNELYGTVEEILNIPHDGLLSFGFIMATYFATRGIEATIDTFDKALPTFKSRNYFHKKWIALKLTFVLTILFIVSIVLITTGKFFIHMITETFAIEATFGYLALTLLNWLLILFLYFNGLGILYKYGPATNVEWRYFSAGATLATILSILTSLGFSFYINNFGNYNKLYGAIGAIIVIMLWIYFNSMILLIGFELNTSIVENKIKINENSDNI